jgi:hypothetical protein
MTQSQPRIAVRASIVGSEDAVTGDGVTPG